MCCIRVATLWTASALASASLFAGEPDRGAELVRQAKIKEAALRSVQESTSQLEQRQSDPDQLAAVLLDDPATYRQEKPSKASLLELEHRRLREAVRDQLEVFAGARTDLPPGWVGQVMSDEVRRIGGTIDTLLAKSFEQRYAQARALAVKVQRSALDEEVRPERSEIERLAGASTDLVDRSFEEIARIPHERGRDLVERYAAQVAADRILFEENEAEVTRRILDAMAQGLEELWRQLRFVRQHDGGGAVERSELEAFITGELTQLEGRYGIFPSALTFSVERARRLESQLFERYLGERLDLGTGCPGLPPSVVLEGLPSSPDRLPSQLDAHIGQRVDQLRSEFQRRLLESWSLRVGEPLRPAFQRRLAAAIIADDAVFNSPLKDCVRTVLEPYRLQLAERELVQVWSKVADLTYELGDHTLRVLFEQSPSPDELELEALPVRPMHLEESQRIFEEKRRSLMTEGKEVVHTQVALVLQSDRKRRFQDDIRAESDRSEERRRFWQDEYERQVLDAWKSRRQGLTAEGRMLRADKYGRLLDLTRENIDEGITPVFQEPERPAVDTENTGGGGPQKEGEGSGRGKGPGGGGGDGGSAGGGDGGGGGTCAAVGVEADALRSQVSALQSQVLALKVEAETLRSQVSALRSQVVWLWLLVLLAFICGGLAGWYWKWRRQNVSHE
jgi:uncharacterized membrane protein YgcG